MKPVWPMELSHDIAGALVRSQIVAAASSTTAYSRQPSRWRTVAPTGSRSEADSSTTPMADPSIGPPISKFVVYCFSPGSMRPRVDGSRLMYWLRTSALPGVSVGQVDRAEGDVVRDERPAGPTGEQDGGRLPHELASRRARASGVRPTQPAAWRSTSTISPSNQTPLSSNTP